MDDEHLSAMSEVPQSIATGQAGVCAGHPLAVKAGVDCLKKGGNAFDAIIATALTLTVVEPTMSGILGVGLAMLNPVGDEPKVCNFSGRLPEHFSLEKWIAQQGKPLSPFVPEAIQGWLAIHEKYASLPFETLCEPAIYYAKNGFDLNEPMAYFINRLLRRQTNTYFLEYYTRSKYSAGDIIVQQKAGDVLTLLASHKADIFNESKFTSPLENTLNQHDCFLTIDDIKQAKAEWETPLTTSVFEHTVSVPPSNSDGIILIESAKQLEKNAVSQYEHNSTDYIDAIVSTLKQALDKYDRWIGIPTHIIQEQENSKHHTTSLLAKDKDGNSVVATQTIGGLFGDGLWVDGLGVPLNGLGSYSYPTTQTQSDKFNVKPGQRVPWPVSVVDVFKDNTLQYMFGTPGGFSIYQTELQVLLNVLVFNMSLADAIKAPRFFIDERFDISLEKRIDESVTQQLKQKGYDPIRLGDYSWKLGCMHGFDATTTEETFVSDPRRHGIAMSL